MDTEIPNQSESAKLWIENGILFCKLSYSDCYLTENQIIIYLSKIEEITKGEPMPFVIDMRKFVGNFSPAAAKKFSDSLISNHGIISQAFVADTLNGKLLINSYKRIYAHDANVNIFGQMESALAYCVEFQKKFYEAEIKK